MLETLKGNSLCRILQSWECNKYKLSGKSIEFWGNFKSSINFSNILIKNHYDQLLFADKKKNYKTIYFDLEKKNKYVGSFKNIIIFNVLEHVFDIQNAILQIKKIMKKKGLLIGSTPFIYRIHYAPSDYNRYTEQFLNEILRKNFKSYKLEVLGFGPFTACYSLIFDFIKYIPILTNFLLLFTILIDSIINIFMKQDLKKLYPIAYFFFAKK